MENYSEVVDDWIYINYPKRREGTVIDYSFDPQIVEIIKNKEENHVIFNSIYIQFVEHLHKMKKKSSGGYFVSYNCKKKTIFFNPCGGNEAR